MTHTEKYPAPARATRAARAAPSERLPDLHTRERTGISDGVIIATIITVHMPRNTPAAASQLWPGILIHVIDIVQPPGIVMPPSMDLHITAVAATQARNSAPRLPNSAGWPGIQVLARIAGVATGASMAARLLISASYSSVLPLPPHPPSHRSHTRHAGGPRTVSGHSRHGLSGRYPGSDSGY